MNTPYQFFKMLNNIIGRHNASSGLAKNGMVLLLTNL